MGTLWTPGGPHKATIHSILSSEALGIPNATIASAVWPSGSLAIYIPFAVVVPITITQLFWHNGATASGNVDMGIYDAAGTKLTSTGSTAQGTVSVLQLVNITDIVIGPGCFYFALAMDNTTGTMFRTTLGALLELQRGLGMAQQASAFALPATATFAALANNYAPACGLIIGPRASV